MNEFTAEANGPAVLTLRFSGVKANWSQWVLLSSDRHHDNVYCDRRLELYHLEQAREREAIILDFGDTFCAMQGKWDPRSSLDDLRPEDKGANYLDLIVEHAAKDYSPFAAHWLLMGKGNHETSILNRHGVDLISALVHRMNADYGGSCHVGGYGGWVRFLFDDDTGRGRGSLNLKYHHGAGGGGPVTRGVIQTNRQAVYEPDAHVIVNGHTHDSWLVPIARERLSTRGIVGRDLLHFVRCAGYKDEYSDGANGWAVEKWLPPKPIGAVWMLIRATNPRSGGKKDLKIDLEFVQAVT